MLIAVISTMDGPDWGGSEELWTAMAHEALAAGHEVVVSVNRWKRKPAQIDQLERAGAHVHTRSRARQRALHRVSPPFSLPVSLRPLRRVRPDVVCLSHGATWDVARDPGFFSGLMRWLRDGRIPYIPVCQYNTGYEPLTDEERQRARAYFESAAAVCFVARANRESTERLLACRVSRAVAIQNPVIVAPTGLPWPRSPVADFACVARLDAGAKGQDILLEALATNRWRSRDWRLTFYGVGPHHDWLQSLTGHFQLRDRVTFAGQVDDIVAVWRRHHVLLLASRAEGTPLALLEAMALARPSVVTDVGGNAEWVVPDETGFLASAPTAVVFRAALEACWQARDQWEAMGSNAHQALVQNYDPTPGRTLLHRIEEASRQR